MTVINFVLGLLFTILKIIGIILLLVLALLLLITGTVLFIPLKYKACGEFDTDASYLKGKAGISWLFHALSVRMSFDDGKLNYYVRVFGIKIVNSEKLNDKAVKSKQQKANENKTPGGMEKAELLIQEKNISQIEKTGQESDTSKTTDAGHEAEAPEERTVLEDDFKADGVKNRRFSKIIVFKDKIFEKISNIKFKIVKICDRIEHVNGVKESYVGFLTTEKSVTAIREIKQCLFKLLCHIKPTRLKLSVSFGLPDPAATGQVYGIMSILLIAYADSIKPEPQFNDVDKAFAKGNFKLKGRIRLIIILIYAVKIYMNKRLREFIAFVKG